MFRSKHRPQADAEVEISVSDETVSLVRRLESDLEGLREMLSDISDTVGVILDRIDSEVAVAVNRVLAESGALTMAPAKNADDLPMPPGLAHKPKPSKLAPEQRVRSSPFTRSPRPEQISWLETVLSDRAWHNANGIAREHAVDEPHFRYMKRAVGARLREMHEEGLVERRDSRERGAMFEYRIPR